MTTRWTRILLAAGLGLTTLTAVAARRPYVTRRNFPVPAVERREFRRDLLPWSKAAGRPDVRAGRSVGFFVWHEGNTVHILSTDESDRGQRFNGNIRIEGGEIYNVKGMKLDRPDRYRQNRPNELQIRFDTHEGEDGVRFNVTRGSRLVLNLRLEGRRTEHIFYGRRMIEAERDPVVFDLSR